MPPPSPRGTGHESLASSGSRLARQAASPVRLVMLGLVMEAVFIGAFVLPYNLLVWLPEPAADLGRMSGATPQSAASYLASVAVLFIVGWFAYREIRRLPSRQAAWIGFAFAGCSRPR